MVFMDDDGRKSQSVDNRYAGNFSGELRKLQPGFDGRRNGNGRPSRVAPDSALPNRENAPPQFEKKFRFVSSRDRLALNLSIQNRRRLFGMVER